MDDMLNVSGHLLSTAEVESAFVEHPACVEAAAVSLPHPVKGECLYCFIVLADVSTQVRFYKHLTSIFTSFCITCLVYPFGLNILIHT